MCSSKVFHQHDLRDCAINLHCPRLHYFAATFEHSTFQRSKTSKESKFRHGEMETPVSIGEISSRDV